MNTPTVTHIPSAPKNYDPFDVSNLRRFRAVSKQSRLSFADIRSMHVTYRSMRGHARGAPPSWAASDKKVRAVVLAYCESRLYLPYAPDLPDHQRLERIEFENKRRVSASEDVLNAALDSGKSARQIQNFDAQVMIGRGNLAAKIASIVYLKYRCYFDSTQIVEACNLKPPAVRIILYRLNIVAESIARGDSKISHQRHAGPPRRKMPQCFSWTPERTAALLYFRDADFPYKAIASELQTSFAAVSGKIERMRMVQREEKP